MSAMTALAKHGVNLKDRAGTNLLLASITKVFLNITLNRDS